MITKSTNLMDYMNEYHSLLYDFYGKEYAAYPCIYYRLDYKNSIVENNLFDAGSYEIVGKLSGWKWSQIYMLPIMFSDAIQNITQIFDEAGKREEMTTTFVLPAAYKLEPLYNDIVIFPMNLRDGDESKYPTFIVTGIEKAINSNKSSYKISVKNFYVTTTDLEPHINNKYIFIDYFKNIYSESDAHELLQLSGLYKNKWWLFKDNHIDITTDLIFQTK